MLHRRLTWLARIILIWAAAIFLRLTWLQIVHHRYYVQEARKRQEVAIEIPAPRGAILDRSGRVLAMSVATDSVYVNPLKVPDLDVAASILSRALHLERAELSADLHTAFQNHRGFLWIKRRITPEEAQRLHDTHLEWIGFQKESQRHYPKGSLLAHVLGGVDFEEKGNAGIEKYLDSDLRGLPGSMRLLTDVKRRAIDSHLSTEARPGAAITLTIDERLQYMAEQQLAAGVEAKHAVSGSVVIMNPENGEILAMASYPTYDPNQSPQPGEDVSNRQNHAVSVPFEPGSVFKVVTLSTALETTRLRPESMINCHGGALKLPGRVVHEAHGGYGVIPMAMVLAKSSNIGAIEIATSVGQQNMYDYVRRFGFGQRSGIELPAESPGKLRKLERWGKTSLASIAMGQEVSVTTVQLARAASVIANGGYLVKPHLIWKMGDETVTTPERVRILKPGTVADMQQMMKGVVTFGTGKGAKLPGYQVAGKTGTAQIYDVKTRHYTHSYNGSFIGMAPLSHPALVMVVTLNDTHGTTGYGGAAAAPVFKAVGIEAMRVLDVAKDDLDPGAGSQGTAAADVSDLAVVDDEYAEPNILEDPDDGDITGVPGPRPPAPGPQDGPRVPNFRGKTMRDVLAEAAAKGLTIAPEGSGIARVQYPPAGSVLRGGERIRVQFAR